MFPLFKRTLTNFRGAILGWGISIGLLGMMLIPFYDTIIEQKEQIESLINSYPPGLQAFFGDFSEFASPDGFLSVEYFAIMPIILGIFAVLAGSGLLASDEENGTMDLLLAQPIRRSEFFWGRLLALVVAIYAILGLAWLGMALLLGRYTLGNFIGPGQLILPFLTVGAQVLLFGTLALALSMLLPSRRMAGMSAGILLVTSYFLSSLSRINSSLEGLATFSPLTYYQSGGAINGLDWQWLSGIHLVALLFALFAWWRFERRDIRVAGEGGWALRLPWQRSTT